MRPISLGVMVVVFSSAMASGQFLQQGTKLVGSGAVGGAQQGKVALSADGNTALVGGWYDDSNAGATWVFTRSGGVWSQQGNKLVGTGAVGDAYQGIIVDLSADGNTAAVGGYGDNSNVGATWVFTRSGGVWSQEGSKLVGTGAAGGSQQGRPALSADGNTLIVGAQGDDSNAGAAWVFTRSGGVWSQQGSKLVGTGAVGAAQQGRSVALSADGNTAIVGGDYDNGSVGAAWVFTRSGGVWSQQGSKLVGSGRVGGSMQGHHVALSADGNTAIVGGYRDNSGAGAAWVFTRSGGVWSQQGSKLVGSGAVGDGQQGISVALSADGNTAIVGGLWDNSNKGAAWVFTRSGGEWAQSGSKLVGTGAVGASQQARVALSADGTTAIVGGQTDNSGAGAAWVYTNTWPDVVGGDFYGHTRRDVAGRMGSTGQWWVAVGTASDDFVTSLYGTWSPSEIWVDVATGDFNNDGRTDVVGRSNDSGGWYAGLSSGTSFATSYFGSWSPMVGWQHVRVGDFSGDGKTDVVGTDSVGGGCWVGVSDGSSLTSTLWGTWSPGVLWDDMVVGDFNGDGKADLAARLHDTGQWYVAISSGSSFTTSLWGMWSTGVTWRFVQVGDFDGDGKDDLVGFASETGGWYLSRSTGSSFTTSYLGSWSPLPSVPWVDVRVGDFSGDGKADIVGRETVGGSCWVALSDGNSITSTLWGTWSPGVDWADLVVADFSGDGKDDVAARMVPTGQWWVGVSSGSSFTTTLWGTWAP